MVKIKIIAVGRTKEGWIKEGATHYKKLLRGYAELQLLELPEEKITRTKKPESILETEAERILKNLKPPHSKDPLGLCMALDVSGRHLSSDGFAPAVGAEPEPRLQPVHVRGWRRTRIIKKGSGLLSGQTITLPHDLHPRDVKAHSSGTDLSGVLHPQRHRLP